MARRSALGALLAIFVLLAASPSAFAATGAISGTVTDASSHAAIQNIAVAVYDSNDSLVDSACTAMDGTYTVSPLAGDTYHVSFYSVPGACPTAPNYVPQFYSGKSSLASADPVVVTDGSTRTGINAAMQPGGSISGTVTAAAGGAPIRNIEVDVYDSSGTLVGFACTASDGTYTISELAGGIVHVGFNNSCDSAQNYAPQFYSGKSSLQSANPVPVTAHATTPNINAAMQVGGTISGTVTDTSSHAPLENVEVDVYDSSGTVMESACTAADGTYAVGGWASGTYHVGFATGFEGCQGEGNFAPQFYSGKSSLQSANPVLVTVGLTTSGINAAMQPPTTTQTLTVAKAGTGAGTVTSNPSGINCGSACVASFGNGQHVTLTATAASGSTFAGWSGGGCFGTGTCPVMMSSPQKVTATFTAAGQLPVATITKAKITKKKHKAVFSFTASNSPTGFECALKKLPKKKGKKGTKKPKLSFNACSSPKTYKHLKAGKYLFEVRTLSAAGTGPAATKKFTL